MINAVRNIYSDLLVNINIDNITDSLLQLNPKQILILSSYYNQNQIFERQNIRDGKLVDQFWTNKYIQYYNTNAIFTHFDCMGDNIINMPLGFIPSKNISQNIYYYKSYSPNNLKYYNKVFWRGRGSTHNIRKVLINFLKHKKHPNIDVEYWRSNGNPYRQIKPGPAEYTTYFEQLKSSDIFLVIRGDLPWLNSFFDALRAGCIPVCIDTFYGSLGWENIDIKTEDILLDLNTTSSSLNEIYQQIIELLANKDRVLHMKNTIRDFYHDYILTDRYLNKHHTTFHFSGWGDFFVAKVLDLVEHNYQITNNNFICSKVKEIKNI